MEKRMCGFLEKEGIFLGQLGLAGRDQPLSGGNEPGAAGKRLFKNDAFLPGSSERIA